MRSSFSQNNLFCKCPREWYLKYIAKTSAPISSCYMDAGIVVHECIAQQKDDMFNEMWNDKKLQFSKLSNDKERFCNMVKKGIKYKLEITEEELSFPDALAYVDAITEDDEILDWKTGQHDKEHRQQIYFYAMLYRRLGKNYKKGRIVYLNTDEDDAFDIIDEDIERIKQWHESIQKQMDNIKEIPECKCGRCEVEDWTTTLC